MRLTKPRSALFANPYRVSENRAAIDAANSSKLNALSVKVSVHVFPADPWFQNVGITAQGRVVSLLSFLSCTRSPGTTDGWQRKHQRHNEAKYPLHWRKLTRLELNGNGLLLRRVLLQQWLQATEEALDAIYSGLFCPGPLAGVSSTAAVPVPALNRLGDGRYPFRVRMWHFFARSPVSVTLIVRQPRLGFGFG
jgi:hypothetical protein